MPANKLRQPSYRLHKPSGQAIVTIASRTHYLGKHGSRESENAYRRALIQHLGREIDDVRFTERLATDPDTVTVKALLAAYWLHAEQTYVDRETGKPTVELDHMRVVIKVVKDLFAADRVQDFGPLKLKRCRKAFVNRGYTRHTVNDHVLRIRRIVRWGVENELVREGVLRALMTVKGLKKGETAAPERRKVQAVPEHHVDVVLPFLSDQLRAVVQLLRLSGARPSEILNLTPSQIDREGIVAGGVRCWLLTPGRHKRERFDELRTVVLGPAAQEVLAPFLDRAAGAFCFSPVEAEAARQAERRARRSTKLWPSHVRHQRRKRVAKRRRPPRNCYTADSLRRAIARACKCANVARWHPYQLRHLAAQKLQRAFGRQVAADILGHRDPRTTEHYLGLDLEGAARVMSRVG